jgi:hypothetical protein
VTGLLRVSVWLHPDEAAALLDALDPSAANRIDRATFAAWWTSIR